MTRMLNILNAASVVCIFGLVATQCPAQSLRQEADSKGILIGTAVNPRLLSQQGYSDTVAREFNMIEPENAMKWSAIRPTKDQFDFAEGDQVVAFAEAHKMKVRGHNLAWSVYNPAWLAKGNFTPDQLSALLQEHITKVVKHYAGKVFAWDVVNEAFTPTGELRHSIWYDQPGIGLADKGTAYIEQAFKWARAADPKALLFYNDYDAEGMNAKSDSIYKMVKDFKSRGVPIDGVGLQMHIMNLDADAAGIAKNMARLAALGVQVQITEMDVAVPLDQKHEPMISDLSRQSETYGEIASTCFAQPACTAFQTWGFTDKYSWINGMSRGKKGMALLFDTNYAVKPTFTAVLDALKQAPNR